jgi:digeranylgeranylglycerophospholipid reductase
MENLLLKRSDIEDYYDIVIIGGGPAGSTAGRVLSESGLKTLLVEKKSEPGIPVRCGEAIPVNHLTPLIDINPDCISNVINGAYLIGPKNKKIYRELKSGAYILKRDVFDQNLLKSASLNGVVVLINTSAVGFSIEKGIVKSVRLEVANEIISVKCKIVVSADGMYSRVDKWLNSNQSFEKLSSYLICMQYNDIQIKSISEEDAYFFVNNEVLPGGYGWVFPKSKGRANVGIAIDGKTGNIKNKKLVDFFRDFTQNYIPYMDITEKKYFTRILSSIPGKNNLVQGNVIFAGDAGRLADPLSGAGIRNAILSGCIAGEVIKEFFRDNFQMDILKKQYKNKLKNSFLNRMKIYSKIRRVFRNLSNEELTAIIRFFNNEIPEKVSFDKLDILSVLKRTFLESPEFIKKVRYVL